MNRRNALIYVCFFLSGAAGLVYEVVWARQLSLFLGITSYAHTAVIAAYMLGLALGSWWIGRWSDRTSQPLRIYALLEIAIGLFAATTPWLFGFLQSSYASWAGIVGVTGNGAHLVRFTIALLALLLPTFLMGGTLPLLVRGVINKLPQLGPVTGRLYGINTLGATAGAALTGFVLLPRIGVVNTIGCGVAVNVCIALVILWRIPAAEQTAAVNAGPHQQVETAPVLSGTQQVLLLAGFSAAGFSALLTQLAWIRSMVLVVGGTVYAFTITLVAFLAGIGLGSLVYSQWMSKYQDSEERLTLAALLAFLSGLMTLLSLVLIARLPAWFLLGFDAGWVEDFTVYQIFIFVLCISVMLLPTLLMGALFPLLAVTWTRSLVSAGQGIGSAYAVNTLGTILGALLGGLVLLPWLGIQHCIVLAASLYVLAAFGLWLAAACPGRLVATASLALFVVVVWLLPPWDRVMMARGVYYHPQNYLEGLREGRLKASVSQNKQVYYKEGIDGTVTVTDDGWQRSLLINGKVDASSKGDLQTQVGLGQIGALMHPDPRNALLIGLGSGITTAALATHDSIEDITVLEISPEVVEASAYFVDENRHVLEDPRVRVVEADARNYVLASDQKWDLIVSEPSNPWVSGVSNLFTEDFFSLIKSKLAPGGIMTQWFHMYGLSPVDVKTVLRAFSANYAHVSIWHMLVGDLILVGSDQPHALDLQRLQTALADPRIGADLARAELGTARELVRHFMATGESLQDYFQGARTNSDQRPYIEFNAPRSLYSGSSDTNLIDLARFLDGRKFRLPLNHQVVFSTSGMFNAAMNLEIGALPGSRPQKVKAGWWVWWQPVEREGQQGIAITDLRDMSWSEDGRVVRAELVHYETPPDLDNRSRTLTYVLQGPPIASGRLDRENDELALWAVGGEPGQGEVRLALNWTCPSPDGGVNRFLVISLYDDPGNVDWKNVANATAGRFRCQ